MRTMNDSPTQDPGTEAGFDETPESQDSAEVERLTAEVDDLRDRWMRAMAEAENARKRGERDRREAEQYGGSRLARDMLPVYDALIRAMEATDDSARAAAAGLVEGIELTLREFEKVFGNHGITVVNPALGDRFDPDLHEAMFEAPVPGTRAGEIIQVMSRGFRHHDRLLRAARVGVSSTPAS